MSRTRGAGNRIGARGANALLVAASLILCLGLLEIGVRRFDPQPVIRYEYSPDTFYAPVPGARFEYRRLEFAVPVSYNSFGMRDRERSLEPTPGGVRIALLGDSQVEAKEVPFDSTFGQRLERRLQGLHPGHPVEVLNFGVSGFGTVATLARYRALAARFAPDIVVYAFMDNDLADNLLKDRQLFDVKDGVLVLRRLPVGGRTRLVRDALDFAKQHFQSYAFLKYRILELRGRVRHPAAAAASPSGAGAANREQWEVLRLALTALAESVQSSGARFLVLQAGTPDAETRRRLGEECDRLGVEYLDLAPVLGGGAAVRFVHDGHWRSEGHRRAAAALEPCLAPLVAARLDSLVAPPGSGSSGAPSSGTDNRSGR